MKDYKVGEVIKCQVTGIEQYGVFVKIDNKYDGLIHISEVTYNYVRDIKDYANIGDVIYAKIIEIDNLDYKMKLSIKDIDYKQSGREKRIIESEKGFMPLKKMLPIWTKEKLDEINNI